MKDYAAHEVKNICLLGHSGSGKTAVVEAMLYLTKVTDRMGKTIDGTSVLDYDAEEIKRGQSVFTSLAPIEWKDHKINFAMKIITNNIDFDIVLFDNWVFGKFMNVITKHSVNVFEKITRPVSNVGM